MASLLDMRTPPGPDCRNAAELLGALDERAEKHAEDARVPSSKVKTAHSE